MPSPPAVDAPHRLGRRVAIISLHTSPLSQPGSGDGGGMNVYVREIASALAQSGSIVTVYTRRTSAAEPEQRWLEPGLSVVQIHAGGWPMPKEALRATIDEFCNGVLAWWATHGQDEIMHANYWLSGLAARQLRARSEVPFTVAFHTLAKVKNRVGEPEPADRELAEELLCCSADGLCAVSSADRADLVNLYDADPEKIAVVPPGVHHALFGPGSRAGARTALGFDDRPLVLFVGRIQRLKGLAVAVEAVASSSSPSVRLLAVGGPSGASGESELRRVWNLMAAHGLGDRVHLHPPQGHPMLSTYYRAADVVVVPSRSESFGLVALEAMSCGTPVVAADVGGLSALVSDGETGLLVGGLNGSCWAKAIDSLLANPVWAGQLGAAGAERSRAYSWRASGALLADHQEAILNHGNMTG